MKLLRLYLVIVLVLFFVLLCTIVSLSLFARIIQVSLDSPPWPGTAPASSPAETIDDTSEQRASAQVRGTDADKVNRGTDADKVNRGVDTDKANRETDTDKANGGTDTDKANGGTDTGKANEGTDTDKANEGRNAGKATRRTEGKTVEDQKNMIREIDEKEEEMRSLVDRRDRLREELVRLQNKIKLLSFNISGRTETKTQTDNKDDELDGNNYDNRDDSIFDNRANDDFLNASSKHRVASDNSSEAEQRLPSAVHDGQRTRTGRPLDRNEDWSSEGEGVRLTTEHDVIPYTRFTHTRLYLLESGLEPRVVEKPAGHRKKAIDTIIEHSLARLNDRSRTGRSGRYGREDFLEGIFRIVPGFGEQYELYFADKELPRYTQMSVVRHLGPPVVVSRRTVQIRKDFIYTVVPLSGRIDKFRKFLDRFVQVAIIGDNKVYLMVVYFGPEGLSDVQDVVRKTSADYHYPHMDVAVVEGKFSRGRALREGVTRCPFPGDVLMFFCDVDIVITTDFLERCRLNTDSGRRVYYPIVFSLYNPRLVSSLQARSLLDAPAGNDTLVLSAENGFWRDFGYGMTCQYRSDFERLNGFSEAIQGWGLEDVLLYRKYLRSGLTVVRATDPGIVHLWHEKTCDPALPGDQYRGCIRSKALNEASHSQLGMLAFAADIDRHRNLTKRRRP